MDIIMNEIKTRWQNPIIKTSIISLVVLCLKRYFNFEIPNEIVNSIFDIVLVLATGYGVVEIPNTTPQEQMQNKWKSPVLKAGLIALVVFVAKQYLNLEIPNELADAVVNTLLVGMVGIGVANNPENKSGM